MSPRLTATQIEALRNLEAKLGGAVTAFVNIADAQHLTELGLAVRSRQGWDITDEGRAYLRTLGPEDGGPNVVTPFI